MKATRKLIPAIALLLISALLLSTATFAWFTNNQTVTVSDIKMTAKAPVSLYIREGSNDTTGANFESNANFQIDDTVLYPVTYKDANAIEVGSPAGWYTAVGTSRTNGKELDDNFKSIGTPAVTANVLKGTIAPNGEAEANAPYAVYGDFDFYTTAVDTDKDVVIAEVTVKQDVSKIMYKAITLKFFTVVGETETAIAEINMSTATAANSNFDAEAWEINEWPTLANEWETNGAGRGLTGEERETAEAAYKAEQKALAIIDAGFTVKFIENNVVIDTVSKDYTAPSTIRVYAYFDGSLKEGENYFIQDDNFVNETAAINLQFNLEDHV